jgi:tryptophan synthase beta subunit
MFEAKNRAKDQNIIVNLSGRGDKDLGIVGPLL